MRMRSIMGLGLGLLLVLPAWRAEADEPWKGPLVCTFKTGTSASHNGRTFKRRAAAPITFEVTAIDLEAQSARIVAKPGATPEPLRIVRALNANHFMEVLTEGFIGLTTIYDPNRKGLYPAVHARHVGVVGQPIVAHYTGGCRAKS